VLLAIGIKIEKSSAGKRSMYIHISGWHTLCFGALTVTRWRRWRSGPRWRPSWWRCTRAFAPPACLWILCCHQQNVNRSGSNMQSSQTLRATSPVLLSTFRCSQTPLELSKVLSDSTRAFSSAPESTCSYGGAFRMLRDLTYRIVKFWSS
jgi:hypothetical protein